MFCFCFTFYTFYKHGEVVEELTHREVNRWLVFILWNFFPFAVWFIVQRKLNELADAQAPRITGAVI